MRALLAAAVFVTAGAATSAMPRDVITEAEYADPTDRYAHGVLGDAIEWGALRMTVIQCFRCAAQRRKTVVIQLPQNRVFEDVAPRLFDVDGLGSPEVIVVESDLEKGARVAVYNQAGLLAANEFIGQRNRWLAPVGVGAADLDGDGSVEIAFVDRPHLAKTLRVYRYSDGALTLVGSLPGVTNHRIGERDIAGGIRDCGNGPEMVVADANWRRVLAVRFDGDGFETADIGPHEGRASFAAAMDCR